jgi:hypothetical protein
MPAGRLKKELENSSTFLSNFFRIFSLYSSVDVERKRTSFIDIFGPLVVIVLRLDGEEHDRSDRGDNHVIALWIMFCWSISVSGRGISTSSGSSHRYGSIYERSAN